MANLERDLTRFSAPVHEYPSFDAFLSDRAAEGVSAINYGTGFLDLLFLDRGADTTIVVFHPAVSQKIRTMPVFTALGVTGEVEANVLCVSDPTLERGVALAWFAGNEQQPLQRDLQAVINHYVNGRERAQHLVFFGPSGGGFAALFYSALFRGSLAICVNPQTNIGDYHRGPVHEYARAAWNVDDVNEAAAVTDVVDVYRGGAANTVAYVQNLEDGHHVRQHMLPWLERIGQSPERLWVLLGEWGSGHQAPPHDVTRNLLKAAAGAGGDWATALRSQGLTQQPTASWVRHEADQAG